RRPRGDAPDRAGGLHQKAAGGRLPGLGVPGDGSGGGLGVVAAGRDLMQAVAQPRGRIYCDVDDWWFAPRFTDGRCPICGWQPEGVRAEPPMSIQLFRRVDWDLAGLVLLAAVLVAIGAAVEHA